jgi:tetratricopeptide (TPR) repeat protein
MRKSAKLSSMSVVSLFLLCFSAYEGAFAQGKEYAGFSGKGDFDKFNKATEITNSGVTLLNAKKTDEAIAKFKSAIEIYPDQTKAHENLGIAYRTKKQFALAEAECKKAVELEKSNWKAWRNLATVYYDEKKYDDAIAAYQSSLTAKPPAAKAAVIKADLQYVIDMKKRAAK